MSIGEDDFFFELRDLHPSFKKTSLLKAIGADGLVGPIDNREFT